MASLKPARRRRALGVCWKVSLGVLLASALVLLLVPLHQTEAASAVTQPIAVTVGGSAPGATGALHGCGVSPSTIDFDGALHNFTASPDCRITVLVPADTALSRYRFGTSASFQVTTCGKGTCRTASTTVFLELNNTYTVASSIGHFGAGLKFVVTGSVGKSASATVCTVTTSGAVGDVEYSCWGWADYGMPVAMPANPRHQPAGTRWEISSPSTYTDTSGGNNHQAGYFDQVLERVSYSIEQGGTGYSPPVLTYYSLGSVINLTLAPSAASIWVDNGTYWSATNPLVGSGFAERWLAPTGSTAGEALSHGVIKLSYYHQYDVVFLYSVLDPASSGAPRASYRQFGHTFSFNLDSSPSGLWEQVCPKQSCSGPLVWVDAGTRVTYQKSMNYSTSTERWVTPTSSFKSSPSAIFNATYYDQFWVTFGYQTDDSSVIAYSAAGPGYQYSVSIPIGYYYEFGSTVNHAILSNGLGGVTPSSAWVDAGTGRVDYVTANSPSGTERWALVTSPDALNVTSSATIVESGYYHQFGLVYSYSLGGLASGASPSPPRLVCNSFGGPYSRAVLTITAETYWCNNGGSWTVFPALLWGSNLTERWMTLQNLAGGVSGSVNTVFTYYHQYLMTFASTTVDGQSSQQTLSQANSSSDLQRFPSGDSLGPTSPQLSTGLPINSSQSVDTPTVTFTQFGSSMTLATTQAGISVWVDAGTSFVYSNPAPGSTGAERWVLAFEPPLTVVASSMTVNFTYYHQYLETFDYTVSGGGSPAAPLVNFTSFGSSDSQSAASGTSSTAWVDAGTTVTYPATITDGVSTWTASTTEFTASSPTTFNPTYSDVLSLLP